MPKPITLVLRLRLGYGQAHALLAALKDKPKDEVTLGELSGHISGAKVEGYQLRQGIIGVKHS